MGLVLLPPALLSIVLGVDSARRDVADLRERLVSTTRAAATPAENILASARDITLALSNLPDIRNGTRGCDADLERAAQGIAFLNNIARVDASGRVICAAQARNVGANVRDLPVWPTLPTQEGFIVSGVTESRLTGRPVVLGILPLRDTTGRFYGSLDVSIDVEWLKDVLKSSPLPPGSLMAVFDRDRKMIAATNANVARAVFAHEIAPQRRSHTAVRTAKDDNGNAWTYATTALLSPDIYVGFAMPDARLYGETYMSAATYIVLPFVMILLAWIAIWIVTDRQLVRWIIYLRRVSAAYRSGHYALRPALEDAPSELRALGDALTEMAAGIRDRDRSLRDAIAQKSLLIKEIHHRVKNNLQVVMSLLSLQAKRLHDPSAQDALKDTSTRIHALALVHRILYEVEDQNSVDVKRLLEQLAEQTSEGFGGDHRNVRVIASVVPRDIASDTAVTLSLFAVEAITNAFKHAFPGGRSGAIRVVLEPAGEETLRLAVEDDGVGFGADEGQSSIGARLIKTFGLQLGGTAEIRSNAGCGTIVEIVFPDPAAKADTQRIVSDQM